MAIEKIEPRLYLIGRRDLPQMNAGKLGAQCAHAADEFHDYARDVLAMTDAHSKKSAGFGNLFTEWKGDRKFGVTITLIGTDKEIRDLLGTQSVRGYVHDETYPMFNALGETFTLPFDTVGWCFPLTPRELAAVQDSGLDLYP